MANRIKQFRYYGEDHQNNQPTGENMISYCNGDVFGDYFPITQLGIQAIPGTKFYLNNNLEPVIIGTTGIYELDLNNQTQINKITIDNDSLNMINNNPSAYLIVDILYDKEDE